ncbi:MULTISPECIES: phasin family protein [Rhodomicrobium]|uniref:phasin family protein n=1 Tax=Rhodomicrobium TaxID=1068 RepID=UPI000B4B14CD|nr:MULTISPECIES: phasin family protein [Rhodomicrobium]
MPAKQPLPPDMPGETMVEAQRAALDMAAKLSALAFKYALELNKIGFELWQKQIRHYAGLPDRLAAPKSPKEVVVVHAELIEKTARDYEDGVMQIANAGQEMARETAQTLDEGREAAAALLDDAPPARPHKPAQRPRASGGSRGRTAR